jgi:cytoskeletal protein RodZ
VTDTTNAKAETSTAIQPGDLKARLVACRDKAGLNLEQAAEEMHLSQHIVRALEAEDFAHLPEPPYVRGYLRSYAKLGGIDPQILIRLYDTLRGAKPEDTKAGGQRHIVKMKVREKPPLSPLILKLAGSALIIMLVGLISLIPSVRSWATHLWASFSAQTNAPVVVQRPAPAIETFAAKRASELAAEEAITPPVTTLANAAQANSTADVPTAPTTIGSILNANADPKPAPPKPEVEAKPDKTDKPATPEATDTATQPADTKPNTIAPDKPKSEENKSTSTTNSATDKPANTNNVLVPPVDSSKPTTTANPATPIASNTPVATATTDPNAAAMPAGQAVVAPAAITGEVNIKLEFTDEVWMQIKDAKKKTLFESLNSAGSTQELKATTPLSFKIGNARGVKVYLNGQLYDQAPYTKGSVARFKLD